ncbi:replication-relaxation family protein [Clostridium sporogenes]|uniref:Replication-relaxation family protein n=1 Tax=Clostridium sporogenes TaxID=1509 RepID=A0A1J1CWV6_CLOSG|nr:hypothetical protein [Clostridium sporogenes]APF26982.1 replication-relaxation family protein [Clostridium sporogenes]APH15789.1 replication-relaxation family protein [Clostridium sporogenes]
MYLTNRDKEIFKFIEQYGSITINQCSKIFFSKCKQNYYQARKRLKLLSDNKYLKRYRKDMRSEAVYYLDKKLSAHDLKVLDIYAELLHLGAEIKYFEREYIIPTKNKEYRADGLVECTKDGYFYPILIEVDYTHFTSNKKLLDIYNSNYFQDKYKDLDTDIFPTVLILRPFLSNNINNLPFNIIYSTMCINNINTLFN